MARKHVSILLVFFICLGLVSSVVRMIRFWGVHINDGILFSISFIAILFPVPSLLSYEYQGGKWFSLIHSSLNFSDNV